MATCYNLDKRILYIHIPKCAGVSVSGSFNADTNAWSDCWLNDAIGGFSREGFPNGHIPLSYVERLTKVNPWEWDRIIAVIRNPFAQQRSVYQYHQARYARACQADVTSHNLDDKISQRLDFASWCRSMHSNGPNSICGSNWIDKGGVYRWWLTLEDGSIPPNVRIIHAETLESELHGVLPEGEFRPVPAVNQQEYGETLGEFYQANPGAEAAVREKFSWSLATHYAGFMFDKEIQTA